MTPLLAQAELVQASWQELVVQVGLIPALLFAIVTLLVVTYRRQIDAQTERTNSKTETTEAINSIATKQTDELNKVNTEFRQYQMASEKTLGFVSGKVDLLSNQLEAERERRQKEHEELKAVIRNLSTELNAHKEKVEKLETELNGKLEEIKALRLERDTLHSDLKDKEFRVLNLEKEIVSIQAEKKRLDALVQEQAQQIQSLAKQLAELDKTIFDTPVKPMPAIRETSELTVNTVSVITETNTKTEEKEKPE
jgi:chromosome segregation ATPase